MQGKMLDQRGTNHTLSDFGEDVSDVDAFVIKRIGM